MGLPLTLDLKCLNFDFLLSLGPGYWEGPSKKALGKFVFPFSVYYDVLTSHKTFPGGSMVKNLPSMQEPQEPQGRSLCWEDSLEKGVATHCSTFAWRILCSEAPGGPHSP